MKRLLLAATVLLPAIALAGCDGGYGYGGTSLGIGYAGSPYAYNGYYDGFYGPIYDGYWGNDNYFYYRRGVDDRRFYRGDIAHFDRARARGEGWREMHGQVTPRRDYRMPNFSGPDGRGRPEGHRGNDHRGDRRNREDPR
jgi:hypothetical protein